MSLLEGQRRSRRGTLLCDLDKLSSRTAAERTYIGWLLCLEILYLRVLLFQKSCLILYRGILLRHLLLKERYVLAKNGCRAMLSYQFFKSVEWVHE